MLKTHLGIADVANQQQLALSGPTVLGLSKWPLLSPPYSPEVLWQIALGELKQQMTKDTFNAWLVDSRVIPAASSPAFLVVAVRNQYACEWLTHQLQPVIVRTLTGMTGYRVGVCFIPALELYEGAATMNPLEDCLHDYLSQFDDEPEMVPSLKRSAHLEQLLCQAGIVPTSPIELPANITPELLNTRLTQGDEPMTNQSTPTLTRVRIYSHITQSRFLHVEDTLGIGAGKVRFFAGTYRRNQGMNAHCHHFLDLADARVIFGALARGEQGFSYKEYKGTPPQTRPEQGRRDGNGAVSRVLSIAVKGENVYIELKTGPGKLTSTGAITPNGKPEVEVNVAFKLFEACRMAASVLAYIHAWDVLRMMVNQPMVSQPVPYLLVATTSEANGVQTGPASPKNGTGKRSTAVANNGRPVTRKDSMPKANGVKTGKASGQSAKPDTAVAIEQPLKYGDGHMVDGQNLTEVQTFQRYMAEKKVAPESKTTLLDYYRKGMRATTASVASR